MGSVIERIGRRGSVVGIVSNYLRDLLKKQVDDKRLVVWFDPEGHYRAFVRR